MSISRMEGSTPLPPNQGGEGKKRKRSDSTEELVSELGSLALKEAKIAADDASLSGRGSRNRQEAKETKETNEAEELQQTLGWEKSDKIKELPEGMAELQWLDCSEKGFAEKDKIIHFLTTAPKTYVKRWLKNVTSQQLENLLATAHKVEVNPDFFESQQDLLPHLIKHSGLFTDELQKKLATALFKYFYPSTTISEISSECLDAKISRICVLFRYEKQLLELCQGKINILEYLAQFREESDQELLEHVREVLGDNIELSNTLFYWLILLDNRKFLSLVLEKVDDIEPHSLYVLNILALTNSYNEMGKQLLSKGLNVNADSEGEYVLIAFQYQRVDFLNWLFDNGLLITEKNVNFFNELAEKYCNLQMLKTVADHTPTTLRNQANSLLNLKKEGDPELNNYWLQRYAHFSSVEMLENYLKTHHPSFVEQYHKIQELLPYRERLSPGSTHVVDLSKTSSKKDSSTSGDSEGADLLKASSVNEIMEMASNTEEVNALLLRQYLSQYKGTSKEAGISTFKHFCNALRNYASVSLENDLTNSLIIFTDSSPNKMSQKVEFQQAQIQTLLNEQVSDTNNCTRYLKTNSANFYCYVAEEKILVNTLYVMAPENDTNIRPGMPVRIVWLQASGEAQQLLIGEVERLHQEIFHGPMHELTKEAQMTLIAQAYWLIANMYNSHIARNWLLLAYLATSLPPPIVKSLPLSLEMTMMSVSLPYAINKWPTFFEQTYSSAANSEPAQLTALPPFEQAKASLNSLENLSATSINGYIDSMWMLIEIAEQKIFFSKILQHKEVRNIHLDKLFALTHLYNEYDRLLADSQEILFHDKSVITALVMSTHTKRLPDSHKSLTNIAHSLHEIFFPQINLEESHIARIITLLRSQPLEELRALLSNTIDIYGLLALRSELLDSELLSHAEQIIAVDKPVSSQALAICLYNCNKKLFKIYEGSYQGNEKISFSLHSALSQSYIRNVIDLGDRLIKKNWEVNEVENIYNLENFFLSNRYQQVDWLFAKGLQINDNRVKTLLDFAQRSGNLQILRTVLKHIPSDEKSNNAINDAKIIGLTESGSISKQKVFSYALNTDLTYLHEYCQEINVDSALLAQAVDLLPFLVRLPADERSMVNELPDKLQTYEDVSEKYASGNKQFLENFIGDHRKRLLHTNSTGGSFFYDFLKAVIANRRQRYKLSNLYDTRSDDRPIVTPMYLKQYWDNKVLFELLRYSPAWGHLMTFLPQHKQLFPDDSTVVVDDHSVRFYYPLDGRNIPTTKILFNEVSSGKIKQQRGVYWEHTPGSAAEELHAEMERIHCEVMRFSPNADNWQQFVDLVARGYWLVATTCHMRRGTPHNAMMWLAAAFMAHNLPPPVPKLEYFFLDNVMLVTSVNLAIKRFPTFFEDRRGVSKYPSDAVSNG